MSWTISPAKKRWSSQQQKMSEYSLLSDFFRLSIFEKYILLFLGGCEGRIFRGLGVETNS